MNQRYQFAVNELKVHNIRLSPRRLKVLEFMCHNPIHPTVDQIYTSIHKDIPNLSKTTVYNTLDVLMAAGLVRELTIDENESHYDINTADHGHFKCKSCGAIFDFFVDLDSLAAEELTGFKVSDKNVYFNGTCRGCL